MRELGLFNLEYRRLREDIINLYKYMMRCSKENGARCSTLVPAERTSSSGPNMECRKFHLAITKNIFYSEYGQTGVSFLGDVQNLTGHCPE